MKKLIFIVALIFGLNGIIFAQSSVLDNYIQEGLTNNLSLNQQNLELEKALKGIEIARSNFLPRLNFTPNYSVAFGGRAIEIPIGDLLNPVYSTLNKLTGSEAFPQVENARERLMPMNFHDTKFEFKLPLYNTDIRYNIALQKDLLNTETAKKKFLEYELKNDISAAYFRYLQSLEAIKIYENTVDLLQKNLTLNKKLVQNETALKDVVLSAEYELSKMEQQVTEARKNNTVAQAYFNFLLNKDLNTAVIADTVSFKNLPAVKSLETYTSSSFRGRPEFEQLNSGIRTTQTLLDMQEKNRLIPQFFIGSNFGFQGFGYKFKNQAYMVGQIGMNWPVYSGGEKKLKIEQTRIAEKVLNSKLMEVRKQTEMQVFQAYQELKNSISNLKNKEADCQRTETIYRMVQNRYNYGEAIFLELSKAQNDMLIARLSQSLSRLEVWLKYAELKKVSAIE